MAKIFPGETEVIPIRGHEWIDRRDEVMRTVLTFTVNYRLKDTGEQGSEEYLVAIQKKDIGFRDLTYHVYWHDNDKYSLFEWREVIPAKEAYETRDFKSLDDAYALGRSHCRYIDPNREVERQGQSQHR